MYPEISNDAGMIASAVLALSAKRGENFEQLAETLKANPAHLKDVELTGPTQHI